MAKVTRIKASVTPKEDAAPKKKASKATPAKKVAKEPVKSTKKEKSAKTKEAKAKKPMSLPVAIITWPFRMILKPFIALGRYFSASWRELRQVRWPKRGATWKMVFAVLVYTALFMVLITLLDMLFSFVFNKILG